MSASLTEGRGLKAFRLSDIPYPIRKRAAKIALAQSDRALPDEQAGYGGLLARLTTPGASPAMRQAIERAAERPSDRVYYVRAEAWEKVMG